MRLMTLADFYCRDLLTNTLPFWLQHGIDHERGGYLTYLDRDGSILCTDKSMWFQGRFAWILARLFNTIKPDEQFLSLALHGIRFIRSHGFAPDGRMYFHVTRKGRPLRREHYPFSECFAAMALAEYGRASGDSTALAEAEQLCDRVYATVYAPGAMNPETFPRTRRTRQHAPYMILLNTLQILRAAGSRARVDGKIDRVVGDIFRYFVNAGRAAVLENVGPEGEFIDSPEGRCLNPGHALETAWFLLEEARYRNDTSLLARTLPIIDWTLERGWDRKYGGLFYFLDLEGKPPQPLEWDMKVWWPHNEGIYAALLAYFLSGQSRYLRWFKKIHTWAFRRFPDPVHGEWFGYLHRDGSVALALKGNNRKGPYHLLRQELLSCLLLKDLKAAG